MSDTDIKTIVFKLLKQIAPDTEPSTLQPGDNIREALGIDSFDALQFLVALDKTLGIDIPEEDYGKTGTLEDLVAYIQSKKPELDV